MNNPSTCPHCNAKDSYWQVERGDSCDACGYWDYYPDAYVPGDTYTQGYNK